MDILMAENQQRELENLSVRMTRVEQDMKAQNIILYELRDMMIAAKGSWRLIMALAGLAGAIGALGAKFLPFLMVK
jgi:hypothetical protein